MPLSNVQKGAIGQFAFLATALVTGKGQLEVYTPAADNEGRDAEVRRHLNSLAAIGIQIKVALSLTSMKRNGRKTYLSVRVHLAPTRIQNDPRLWYFFAVYDPRELRFLHPVFLVPARVFHKIGRRGQGRGVIYFGINANLSPDSVDRWARYRVALRDLGKRLLENVDDVALTANGGAKPLPAEAVVIRRVGHRGQKAGRLRNAA